jgi:hypothetical protein
MSVGDTNKEWSEEFSFPLELSRPYAHKNTRNVNDHDKLRQQRKRSVQSKRREQQKASERLLVTICQNARVRMRARRKEVQWSTQ